LLVVCACNRSGGDGSSFAVATVSASDSGAVSTGAEMSSGWSSSTTSGASSSTSGGQADSTSGGVLDLGGMPDFDPTKPEGCGGKIDFVFAISADPTMKGVQGQLKASFAGFVEAIEAEFAEFDYHILVPNIGGLNFIPACEGCQEGCPNPPPEFPCDGAFMTCDRTYGAGLTFPTGWNASNARCELFGGHRYIIKDDPDLLGSFECIASVGTSGASAVVEVALKALSEDLQVCNDGFLRDDALLVVTLITHIDDFASADQPPDWTQALLEAKGGDPHASVVLIVMNDAYLADGLCEPYQPGTYRLVEWSEMLPHVRMGSTCTADFTPFFVDAVGLIKEQCDGFIPR
jgi:hypothetical protein